MRVAVAIDEGKAENADVEAIHSEEGALSGELAREVTERWRASVVLARGAASVAPVDEPGADEHKPFDAGGARQLCQALRAEIVDGMCLLGGSAWEEEGG